MITNGNPESFPALPEIPGELAVLPFIVGDFDPELSRGETPEALRVLVVSGMCNFGTCPGEARGELLGKITL